jgi:hypothetical protein
MIIDPLTSNCALGTVPPRHRLVSVRFRDFPVRPRAYSMATSSAVRTTFQTFGFDIDPVNISEDAPVNPPPTAKYVVLPIDCVLVPPLTLLFVIATPSIYKSNIDTLTVPVDFFTIAT